MYSQLITLRGIAHEVRYTLDTIEDKEYAEIISVDQTSLEDLEIDMITELQKILDQRINSGEQSAVDQYFDDEGFFGNDDWYDRQRNA